MQLGICVPNYRKWCDAPTLLRLAREAEELGYASLWVNDHVVAPTQGPEESLQVEPTSTWMNPEAQVPRVLAKDYFGDQFLDPWVTWGFLAAVTTRVRLGSSIIVLPYRNPIVQAKMCASLDVLSGGRVVLGVGSGHVPGESEVLGVPYRERAAMTDEWLEIITTLCSQPVCSYRGRYFSFEQVLPLVEPVQKPHPPIYVGGNSKSAIRRAARLGQGWHPSLTQVWPEHLKLGVAYLQEASVRAERPHPPVVAPRLGMHLVERSEDAFPRGRRLRLTPGQAVELIQEYEAVGASEIILNLPTGTREVFFEQVSAFASDVLPRL